MRIKFFFLALLLGFSLALTAQQTRATIHLFNGASESFVLGISGGIYFGGDTIQVVAYNGAETAAPINAVSTITFAAETNSIVASRGSEAFSVSPNPTTGSIRLRGVGAMAQKVTLYSMAGTKVMERTCSEGGVLNLSQLNRGVYILRCGEKITKVCKQ